jgi:LDH2 family malate/lactate/ureidoglycolate dehydrogenase
MNQSTVASLPASRMQEWASQAFIACDVPLDDAALTAEALVEADLQGVASHGCMLIPMYVDRLRARSVNPRPNITVVEDRPSLLVIDADHGLGQVSSARAVSMAIERAGRTGVGMVAVRHAFHFGTGAFWSCRIAAHGMIGAAMSNTRPLMPAPGGSERLIGNNPLSFAFPAAEGEPLVVDMATSSSAMGKIRNAERQGRSIPQGWATDKDGNPTTSPTEAIAGMLLPAAGPKGFGLAVMIDLLCGGISGGSIADQVQPLYGPADRAYDCAHWFMAIDAGQMLGDRAATLARRIRQSRQAAGVERIYAPGDLERHQRSQSQHRISIEPVLMSQLHKVADTLGLERLLLS